MNIDNIYKKAFAGERVEATDLSWLELESKLDSISFFKFTLSKFNVFYAGLIAGTFLVSTAIGVDYFVLNKNNSIEIENEQLQAETPIVSTVTDTIQNNNITVAKKEKKRTNEVTLQDNITETTHYKTTNNFVPASSPKKSISSENDIKTTIIDDQIDINDIEASNVSEKQKIIVIQQPKVIVRDTVYENKATWRKNKKKP